MFFKVFDYKCRKLHCRTALCRTPVSIKLFSSKLPCLANSVNSIVDSSVGKRAEPSQNTYDYKLKCVICNKIQENGISRIYRICGKGCAKSLRENAMFLAEHVYTRFADLDTNQRMFTSDIYYHVNCFTKYMQRFKTANTPSVPMNKEQTGKRSIFQNYIKFIDEIISRGNGITLSEVHDMINTN